jgi:hypothetical protein
MRKATRKVSSRCSGAAGAAKEERCQGARAGRDTQLWRIDHARTGPRRDAVN